METIKRMEKAILEKRGFETETDMLLFRDKMPEDLPPFSSLLDGDRILSGLAAALEQKKTITVYGDYDADGVMSMTILYKGLNLLNPGKIHWFANDRFRDGYSISVSSLGNLLEKYPDTEVILTCDNGIGAAGAWEEAGKRGLQVFVTDHHEQGEDSVLPDTVPAVCEKSVKQKAEFLRQGKKPEEFCGAELCRRLITELYVRLGLAEEHAKFLKGLTLYAGIATITDVVPLNASNHCVARRAVKLLREDTGFWKNLYAGVVGTSKPLERAEEDTFAFYFGPAINACSRVKGSVELPMEVFLSGKRSPEKLQSLIGEMAAINQERREWSEQDLAVCEKIIKEQGSEDEPFLLVADERLREGINGLSAGRLTEKYRVPAVVLGPAEDPEIFKGSARSVDSVNIFEELYGCRDLLVVYGGHPKAAGLTIRKENLPEFGRRMKESIAKKLVKEELRQEDCDFPLILGRLAEGHIAEMQEAMESLRPFGEGFGRPTFFLEEDVRNLYFMSEGVHAKAELTALSADHRKLYLLLWNRGKECREWEKKYAKKISRVKGAVKFPEINEYHEISYQMQAENVQFL